MFLYLSKLFSDFLQFEGNLIHEQNNVTDLLFKNYFKCTLQARMI